MDIVIHPRIHERHPEILDRDVQHAIRHVFASLRRDNGQWVSVGFDMSSRPMELIYKIHGELTIIFHALRPPTEKVLKELGIPVKK